MADSDDIALDWVSPVSHPVVVNTSHTNAGRSAFEGASPHLVEDAREIFLGALRSDIGPFTVERARSVFRNSARGMSIAPELCRPYTEANACGYWLKNVLPIVFVRTERGELLPEARVAVKYLRENQRQFADTLDAIENYGKRIFKAEAYIKWRPKHPHLFSDIVQPYAAITPSHMMMGTGCYAQTPPGMATMLGAAINQRPRLEVHTGLMETEWFRSQMIIVFDCPQFTDRLLLIEPGTVVAQVIFVAKEAAEQTVVCFSEDDPGSEVRYHEHSKEVGRELIRKGRGLVVSELTGVKSISLSCPHCWASVTAATKDSVPEGHVERHEFYRGYNTLRAEYKRARRRTRHAGKGDSG
jgi:hypothetical protein